MYLFITLYAFLNNNTAILKYFQNWARVLDQIKTDIFRALAHNLNDRPMQLKENLLAKADKLQRKLYLNALR